MLSTSALPHVPLASPIRMAQSCTRPTKPNLIYHAYPSQPDACTLFLLSTTAFVALHGPALRCGLSSHVRCTAMSTFTLMTASFSPANEQTCHWTYGISSLLADATIKPADLAQEPAPVPCLTTSMIQPHTSLAATHSATPAELGRFRSCCTLFPRVVHPYHAPSSADFSPLSWDSPRIPQRKHPPQSVAMVKGHLDQTRKNQRSNQTQVRPPEPGPPVAEPADTAVSRSSEPDNDPHASVFCCHLRISATAGQIHTDQTGKFIVASSNGNNYILVAVRLRQQQHLGRTPLRSRTGPCILAAFTGAPCTP
jgi:hypothetical protein